MFGQGRRPSDLAFYCLAILGAFALGSALYAMAGEKFMNYVEDKLPEIQAQMEEELDFGREIETNFSSEELSNFGDNGFNSEE
jgi:hypothetical protein